ncbi:GNAT family N-acetyltransferase [Neisseria weixii]|uniref:GNAT family N-acetyltransferase n=1 Tax=Neisseria weixii TaxID=1853276 RepID=A0A3N4MVJ9_9NEIS|nr:bifunctional acetate--CoA ligase family protein/GNAT family N-acetyltransferase [Neisseria weixii]RPD85636.1 GNAT family N-acetyltransferase [Neisseria weixii]RPD86175.1 GNAT family N-acetyltransferase [Neisseria weixii]
MNTQPMPGYFFMPQHIILVGASERPHTLGERILTALLGSSFQGDITPVNLRHKTVAGLPAYPNLNKIDSQADLVIAVTPPNSYETLFKACRKKQLHHLILIQDWESLSEEDWQTARQAIQKHHGQELNISVCSPAGIQLPTQGLNTGVLPDFPAGHVALLTGQASVSSEIDVMLRRMQQGVSRHISLNYDLSPTSAADWINRFGHNRHTRIAVVHHNPAENQRKLFSAIRHFTRHTPMIVHCTHAVDDTERAILESLSRHCNFLLTLNHNELSAALRARLSDIKPSNQLTALGNTPIGWLQPIAAEMGIQLTLPSEKSNLQNGYLGSMPTAAHYRSMAAQQLQQNHTQSLLAVIAPSADQNETAIAKMLNHLTKQTGKPLLVSSHVSDGLLHFPTPEQALQTLYLRNIAARLQQVQHEIAPAKSGRLKNIDSQAVTAAKDNSKRLAAALHLPTYQNGNTYPLVKLTFRRHPQYGTIISAADLNRTIAILPPFTTLDTARLLRFADLNRYQDAIEQFVHSMNTLVQNPELFNVNGEIILNISSNQISTDVRWPAPPTSPSHKNSKPSEKTIEQPSQPTADGFNHRMQAAAEFLRYSNARASEFIRTTSEAAAEFWHQKNNTGKPKPVENVLAPYPTDYPSEIRLKNGQTVSVRPFEPEDAEAKQQFIRRLSPQSRYTRFMTRTNELPQPTLARFSKLDYHSEGAWIAENSDGLIVAVSRFSRLTRDECEFGITLSEDMRGSGLAHKMMQLIIRLATQQGYLSMSATILKENTAMLKLAEKSGFSLMESEQDKNLYQAKLNLLSAEEKSKEKFRQ